MSESIEKNQGEWLSRAHRRPTNEEMCREQLLEDWVGMERAASIKADLRPKTPSISELVAEVMRKFDLEAVDSFDDMRSRWADIVGAAIADACAPANLSEGRLTIAVHNPTWRYVLEVQQKKALLAKIQSTFGKDLVKAVRFISG